MADTSPPFDGPAKVTGNAKYTYDIVRPGMLYARIVHCPHAHSRITRLDTAAAAAMPGVKAVRVIQGAGTEIQWALDEVVLVAAATEEQAEDAARAVVVEYEVLPHHVDDMRLDQAPGAQPGPEETAGDPDKAMAEAAIRFKGTYGMPAIARNSLEAHSRICGLNDTPPEVPAGGEPGASRWDSACAEISRKAGGVPVKLMLERAAELALGGDRPSACAEIEVGASADGILTAWISKSWGSGGLGGSANPLLPYVVQIPNRRQTHTVIPTNTAGSRVWPASNQPQGCYLTMSALDDLCARLGMDPLAFYRKNEGLLGSLARTYVEALEIADRLMGWSGLWKPRGPSGRGPVQRGLGLSLHLWEGSGGVQMADVEVDRETGVVKVRKMVAVQDWGPAESAKAAESQIRGALVLGISSALSEEKVIDPVTGTLLNVDFESYKMAGIADVGELVVHMMTEPGHDERGVTSLGEPPVISPAAAIANAVANALGVRVPYLPLTPQRVLDALEAHGKGAA